MTLGIFGWRLFVFTGSATLGAVILVSIATFLAADAEPRNSATSATAQQRNSVCGGCCLWVL